LEAEDISSYFLRLLLESSWIARLYLISFESKGILFVSNYCRNVYYPIEELGYKNKAREKNGDSVNAEIIKSIVYIYLFGVLYAVFKVLCKIKGSSSSNEVISLSMMKEENSSDCLEREIQVVQKGKISFQ
jgi:hypothetical protein